MSKKQPKPVFDFSNVDEIKFSFYGNVESLKNKGMGKYPYECIHKDKNPNSFIFVSEDGGWLASDEFILIDAENEIYTTDFYNHTF